MIFSAPGVVNEEELMEVRGDSGVPGVTGQVHVRRLGVL